jgi:site-specific recombinase XerD
MELSAEKFLESVSNQHTRKEYRYGVKAFCDWFGKSPEEILKMRQEDLTQRPGENLVEYKNRAARFEREIEAFHDSVLKQGKAINTARTVTLGIRQLFRFYQMPILMRKGSKVTKTVKTTRSFPLRIEHVREMFKVADLRERVILSLATDLGLRMSDFLKLKKTDIPDLNQQPPIPFEIMTGKEYVVASGFLSSESVELLKSYMNYLDQREKEREQRAHRQHRRIKKNPYLFPSNGNRSITEERINGLLKSLSEKAKITTSGKSLTFHCFRKMYLSASIDSGIGLTAGKKMVGKAIPQSDDTYLTTVKLKDKFIQLKKSLTIQQIPEPESEKQIQDLKDVVTTLQKKIVQTEKIAQTVTEDNEKITKKLDEMRQDLQNLQTFYKVIRDAVPENLLAYLQRAKMSSDETDRYRVLKLHLQAYLDQIEEQVLAEEENPKALLKPAEESNKKEQTSEREHKSK